MNKDQVTNIWQEWDNVRAYQAQIGLLERLNQNVNFFEGRQWPPATEKTKTLPRPVFNIVKMICRNKVANILAKPVRITYKAYDNQEGAEKFTRFAEFISKELKQDEVDGDAVRDGAVKGCYIYHYYWDAEAKGKKGRKEGALRVELIDPLNFGVHNPREPYVQKQKWVIIASREEVEAVKAMADKTVDKDLIKPDDNDFHYDNDKEQENSNLCTVLTKYFRQNGEVFFTKSVKGVVINKPKPLTPNIKAAQQQLGLDVDNDGVDAAFSKLPESEYKEPVSEATEAEYKAHLYPIVVGNYERMENCIYGLSEIEGLIPNQKAINFSIAMKLLLEQNMAWGKFIAKDDALRDQEVTNEPGQVLIDYSKQVGQGFYYLPTPPISSAQLSISETIISLTRSLSGATEVMHGELPSANLSGAAIAQLQSQAKMPVEELRKRFWRVKEQQGRIYEQFFKLFYDDAEYVYQNENDEEVPDKFDGTMYKDTQFSVVVEAVGGTRASSATDIQVLTDLAALKIISPLAFVSTLPDDFITNKSELIKIVKEEQNNEKNALMQAIQQATAQLKQDAEIIRQQQSIVDKAQAIINENRQLKALLLELAQPNAQTGTAIPMNAQQDIMNQFPIMGEDIAQGTAYSPNSQGTAYSPNSQGTAYSPIAPNANNGSEQWMM